MAQPLVNDFICQARRLLFYKQGSDDGTWTSQSLCRFKQNKVEHAYPVLSQTMDGLLTIRVVSVFLPGSALEQKTQKLKDEKD